VVADLLVGVVCVSGVPLALSLFKFAFMKEDGTFFLESIFIDQAALNGTRLGPRATSPR
jgi:hypothetical protein